MNALATITEPRAWVGCLACYNDGRLVGQWVDGLEAGELTTEELHASEGVTVDPTYGPHEELWIMDHEGYGPALSGECSPVEAQRVAEALDSIDEHQRDAFAAWLDHVGDLEDALGTFTDAYLGSWDSVLEYAWEYVESSGVLDDVPELLARYFDCSAFARDLELGGDVWTAPDGSGVFIFDGHA